jgi:glutathione S-transferase
MLTLIHAPHSRSTRIISLLKELDALADIDVRQVDIQRAGQAFDGDARNPHPEGKVPLLIHDGVEIWESPAIILYLTDLYAHRKLGAAVGDKDRGRYLSWLSWYGGVIEPVLLLEAAGISHPYATATFRGPQELHARLIKALSDQPYLMGDRYTAADLLLHSPFAWFPDSAPSHPAVQGWIQRCGERPSVRFAAESDAALAA